MHDPPPGRPSRRGRHIDEPSNTALPPLEAESVPNALRVGAKALITSTEGVLLIKERRADGSSFWTIPGGGVEANESLPECLRRELEEEIRCRSTVGDVIDTYVYAHTTRHTTTVYTIFEASLHTDPAPNRDERIVDCAWVEPTNLPSTTLAPVRAVVEDATNPSARTREETD
jgi:8-oxo-dGTP diphosphatase